MQAAPDVLQVDDRSPPDEGPSRHVSRARLLARLLVIPLLWACGDAPTGPSTDLPAQIVDLSLGWSTAEATRVGFDGRRLGDALEHARDLDFLRGLVIARNGYLVHEEYYGGHTRDSLADVRSVTKAVISTLVGIAIPTACSAASSNRWASCYRPAPPRSSRRSAPSRCSTFSR